MKTFALLIGLFSVAHAAPHYPQKIQFGLHPAGVQVGFTDGTPGGYRFNVDVAGRLKGWDNGVAVWLGGGVNYAYGTFQAGGVHNPQFFLFTMISLDLSRVPLVPFFRIGPVGDLAIANGNVAGGGGVRLGGGFDYWFTRIIGAGVETHFTLGGAAVNDSAVFYGSWDFLFGMRLGW